MIPRVAGGLSTGEDPTRPRTRIAPYFWVLTVLLISCDLSGLVTQQFMPSPIPGIVGTIVDRTAAAAGTQTAVLIPPTLTTTFTPLPTWTPYASPTLTPTFVFRVASRTPTPKPTATNEPTSAASTGSDLSCTLLSQTPSDGTRVDSKKSFTVAWKVKNTGAAGWDSAAVDFIYVSGAKMASATVFDLPDDVASGNSMTLTITMKAPNNSGTYTTTWSLRQGKNEFCHVDLRIIVR